MGPRTTHRARSRGVHVARTSQRRRVRGQAGGEAPRSAARLSGRHGGEPQLLRRQHRRTAAAGHVIPGTSRTKVPPRRSYTLSAAVERGPALSAHQCNSQGVARRRERPEAPGARAARVSPRDLAQARPRAPAGRSRRQEPRYAAASAPGGDRPRLGLELLIRPLCVTPFIFAGRWESSTRNDWQKRESINGSLPLPLLLSKCVCQCQ